MRVTGKIRTIFVLQVSNLQFATIENACCNLHPCSLQVMVLKSDLRRSARPVRLLRQMIQSKETATNCRRRLVAVSGYGAMIERVDGFTISMFHYHGQMLKLSADGMRTDKTKPGYRICCRSVVSSFISKEMWLTVRQEDGEEDTATTEAGT